jgi:ribonuclease BN (tRNA processing enzyme)
MATPPVVLRFLGSGDAFASGGRFQTCFLLEVSGSRYLIDCGASSLVAMKRSGIEPTSVHAILVTHLHGDHFGGIPFFLLDARFRARRTQPLTIAGPPGSEARIDAAMEAFFPGSTAAGGPFPLEFVELEPERARSIGPLEVTAAPVVHASGAPAYALRIGCGGKVVAYSGDTEWTDALIDVARDADVFVCESYFHSKRVAYHLDYQTLMEHRDQLTCRRLILTHMSDDMLDRVTELDVEVAVDGESIEI